MDVTNIEPVDVEKVTEENPQSRFRILNAAIHKPGVCALCGSAGGDDRQFVDFGKTMDWYGVVYFCTFCVAEAAILIGFATHGKYDELFKKYEEMLLKYGNEKLEVERLQEQLNAARLLLRNCHCDDPDSVGDDNLPDAMVVEDSGESESDSDDDTESVGVEGSDDVPESSVDESSSESKPKRTRRASSSS